MRTTGHGFTLMEVLLVIFVIGVLATWAIGNYAPANLQAEDQAAQAQLQIIRAAANSYKIENNVYPANLPQLIGTHIQDPNTAGNWFYALGSSGTTSLTVTATGVRGAPGVKGRQWQINQDGIITRLQ